MTITVYELLGLMLRRQAPKRIKVLGFTMNYVKNAHWGDYEDESTGQRLSNFRLNECLNDEVEILEENKIEKIKNRYTKQAIDNYKLSNFNSNDMKSICKSIGFLMENSNISRDKIDEIIDEINKFKGE